MRLASRRDANHGEITCAFERCGWRVLDLSRVGGNCPDLLIAKRTPKGRVTALVEVKTAKGTLSPGQSKFAALWPGNVYVCRSAEDVMGVIREN